MEATYILHHCARAALAGHLGALPMLAKDAEGPMRQAARDIVEGADIILADHEKEQMRNSLGLHNASENVVRSEGMCGKRTPLGEIPKLGSYKLQDIGPFLTPPVLNLNVSGAFDWSKIIVNGQEYNASAHQRLQTHGCYALVHTLGNQERAAIIHRLLEIQCPGESHSQAIAVCLLFPNMNVGIGLQDMYRKFELGFIVERNPEPDYIFLSASRIICALVITPVEIKHHLLTVAYPYNRVRRASYLTESALMSFLLASQGIF